MVTYLYNKTRHIYIYAAYSWPNGWTDWANIFCGWGCAKKNLKFFFLQNLVFSTGNAGPFSLVIVKFPMFHYNLISKKSFVFLSKKFKGLETYGKYNFILAVLQIYRNRYISKNYILLLVTKIAMGLQ